MRSNNTPIRFRNGVRRQSGFQLVEFGTALWILIGAILVPLLSIALFVVRVSMVQYSADRLVARLARSESFSQACAGAREARAATGENSLGLDNLKLSLLISTGNESSVAFTQPGSIPANLLTPDNAHNYTLHLDGDINVEVIPGQGPVKVHIGSNATWENLGRNPITKQFYVNE